MVSPMAASAKVQGNSPCAKRVQIALAQVGFLQYLENENEDQIERSASTGILP
jgi:hypothetical protein